MYSRRYPPDSRNTSSLNPPWALNVTSPRRSDWSRGSMGSAISGVDNLRVTSNPGSRHEDSRAANSRNNSRNSAHSRGAPRTPSANVGRIRRYGRRMRVRPYDRDLPFWLRLYPFHPPSRGTDSNRARERESREGRALDERRAIVEDAERLVVTEDVPIKKDVLTVLDYDLHFAENTKRHHTDQYECTEREQNPQLVVRRGQVFLLTLSFQRPWNKDIDDLFLEFTLGDNPSLHDGSLVEFQMAETARSESGFLASGNWGARVDKQDGNKLTLFVYPAPDAMIGEWECHVTTRLEGSEESFSFDGIGEIFVLFNPWCSEDQVFYTEKSSDLQEYVLNEYGCIFDGDAEYISSKPWFYGQFREGIPDVCMTILRMAFDRKMTPDMGDAVTVTRKLSRMLNNSSKDPGVMTGNWSGNFSDGTPPMSWRGSVKILREYARTKQPVKYAQCWVFSHVLTTVCRALGIPCRSLTNYESAHDTDKTVTIDSYQDEDGNDLPHLKSDSIWNFHCWNDVWINRPDLDTEVSARGRYSGWHAVDATPQERSNGRFQCGPCPHKAIKNGELSVGHDTNFIYGEVNGEVCTWLAPRDRSRDLKLLSKESNAVGKNISTKVPDGKPVRGTLNAGHRGVHSRRRDITSDYKFPEGSIEERESLKLAVGKGFGAQIFQEAGGVSLELGKLPPTMIGSDFPFRVVVINNSAVVKVMDLILGVYPIKYTGERIGWSKVAFQTLEGVTLRPGMREAFVLPVYAKSYLEQCDKAMSMMLRAFVKVKGEEKPLSKLKKITLAVPELQVKASGVPTKVVREKPFTVTILATNPCSKPIGECELLISGSVVPVTSQGFQEVDGTFSKKIKDIFPNQTMTLNLEVKALRKPLNNNSREMEVDIRSNLLPDITGSLDVEVL